MTTRYVDGTDGNDANDGLAAVAGGGHGPKKSLTGAEDTPVVAGDLVHVRPGVYRETLTCDVSGAAGSPIEYRGDYAGLIWPGGGVVRITGSDDDKAATRNNCIVGSAKDYRTFTGFHCDTTLAVTIQNTTGIKWIIQRCYFEGNGANDSIRFTNSAGVTDMAATVTNCAFLNTSHGGAISFRDTNATTSTNVVSNCLVLCTGGLYNAGIQSSRVGGITIRNCTVIGGQLGAIRVENALPVGYTPVSVTNCTVLGAPWGLRAANLGEIVEDYNNIYGCSTARSNVAVGAHSLAYPPLLDSRWFFELVAGGKMLSPFDLASYSQLVNVAGTTPTTTDMRGTGTVGAEREWGALEYDPTLLIESASGGGAVRILPGMGGIG